MIAALLRDDSYEIRFSFEGARKNETSGEVCSTLRTLYLGHEAAGAGCPQSKVPAKATAVAPDRFCVVTDLLCENQNCLSSRQLCSLV